MAQSTTSGGSAGKTPPLGKIRLLNKRCIRAAAHTLETLRQSNEGIREALVIRLQRGRTCRAVTRGYQPVQLRSMKLVIRYDNHCNYKKEKKKSLISI